MEKQRSKRSNNGNIFGKPKTSSRARESYKEDEAAYKIREERLEREFDKKAIELIKIEDW